ncbi:MULTISPECIES: hypothetical protein [unclassified Burkholderia]|uniref:hypothetical protein n=1 Tax=unclassified Burkholderia TaxID=2613784 RepID=UPI002AB29BF6|nr:MULTISPECIES: hypothetical protein [unclassified Burkholderia]
MEPWFDATCGTGDLCNGGDEGNDVKVIRDHSSQTFTNPFEMKKARDLRAFPGYRDTARNSVC